MSYANVLDKNTSSAGPKDNGMYEIKSLDEILSTTPCTMKRKRTSTTAPELQNGFGDELCGHLKKMTEYWHQFGYFDMAASSKIVADISRISISCVKQTVVPTESDDDENKEDPWEDEAGYT